MEEEQLLNDLKRKSEETLQKLKVEELTLIRYVRSLTTSCADPNQPIVFAETSSSLDPLAATFSGVTNITTIASNPSFTTTRSVEQIPAANQPQPLSEQSTAAAVTATTASQSNESTVVICTTAATTATTNTTTVPTSQQPHQPQQPIAATTGTFEQLEQTVNSTALLSLDVNDLLLGMLQEPEVEEDDEDEENFQSFAKMQN